jgi:hypothetical protein
MIQQDLAVHTAHIMLDLETFGTEPNAMVTSIGACEIDFLNSQVGRKFYRDINLNSYKKLDYSIDPDTVLWWVGKNEVARNQLTNPIDPVSIRQALVDFMSYVKRVSGGSRVNIWGNGVDFDNAILKHFYRQENLILPWTYRDDRCYRTIKNIFIDGPLPAENESVHHALHDSVWQANHLILINNRHNLRL